MSEGLLANPVEHDHPIRSILIMPETTAPSGSADSLAGASCIANGRVVRALPNSGIGLRHSRVADASPAGMLDFTAAGRRFIHRIALDFTVRTLDFTGSADFRT